MAGAELFIFLNLYSSNFSKRQAPPHLNQRDRDGYLCVRISQSNTHITTLNWSPFLGRKCKQEKPNILF